LSASIPNAHYSYDLAGDLTSWKNPSGDMFTHTISNARRITQITSSVSDSTHPSTLAQNIKYAPHGTVAQLQNGCVGTGCTQEQETYDYNNRLQTARIQLGTSGSSNANSCLVYNYYSGVGNPSTCTVPTQASSGNDGAAMGHYFQDTTNPSLGHTATYAYDTVNRLASSVATGSSTHNLTFSYDRYGNMTCVTNQQTNGPCPNYTFSSSNNQITNAGYSYDAAGNLTADGSGTGSHTYQWDAENRLKSIDNSSTATYIYNALGQRVEKIAGGAYTEYTYHASGEELAENDRSSWAVRVIPFAGRHLAHYQGSTNAAYFMHINSLGSTSQATDYRGATAQDQLYYPWGQEWNMVGNAQEKRFARLAHRDTTETGLDPTHFRMLSSTQGRWLSRDPRLGCIQHPQSLNLYSYVHNSPTNKVDPRGDLAFPFPFPCQVCIDGLNKCIENAQVWYGTCLGNVELFFHGCEAFCEGACFIFGFFGIEDIHECAEICTGTICLPIAFALQTLCVIGEAALDTGCFLQFAGCLTRYCHSTPYAISPSSSLQGQPIGFNTL